MPDLTKLRAQLAFGADLSADPIEWAFTDMADPATLTDLADGAQGRLFDDSISLRVGQTAEGSQAMPASVTFDLDNSDGYLTPGNPLSPWWPYVDLDEHDLPCQLSVQAGSTYLDVSGSGALGATTPDHADFDITTDHTGRCLIVYTGTPRQNAFLGPRKYTTTADQRSWLPWIDTTGYIWLRTSPDGTLAASIDHRSTTPIPYPGIMAIGWQLDVDDGAGNHTVRFEYAPGIGGLDTPDADWTPLGDPVVTPGTTSVFNSTSTVAAGQSCPYPILAERLYTGLGSGGALRASPSFMAQPAGTTSFTDLGKTWTVTGSITDWRVRLAGFVESIELIAPYGRVPGTQRVRVTVAGELRRLETGEKPIESALTRLVSSPANVDGVIVDWPHEDGSDSTVIASATPGAPAMRFKGNASLSSDGDMPGHAPVLTIPAGQNLYRQGDIPQIPQVVGVNWAVTQFFRIGDPAVSPANTQLMAVDTNGRVATWRVTIDDTQVAITGLDDDAVGVVLDTFPSDARFFDTAAMIVLEVTDDGVNVDWALTLIPVPLGVGFGTSGTFVGNTGIPTKFRNSCTGPPSGISLGHLIVSTNRPIGWLAPADTGFVGERAGRRALRLAAEQSARLSIIGDPDDTARMGPQGLDTFTGLVRECADVDGGRLFDGFDHGLVIRTRASMYNQPVAMKVDGDQKTRALSGLSAIRSDRRSRRTHMTVARPDGSDATATVEDFDPASRRVFDETLPANVDTDLALPDQASWRLHLASTPGMRFPQIKSLLTEATGMVDEWLAMVPGSRATVANPGPGFPPGLVDQLVEGWTETVRPAQWDTALACTPALPWTVGVWDDEDLGRYDTAGSETGAGFDAGVDTSLTVATTKGQIWTVDAGDMPFEIITGGVVLNVTNVTGASSPQTFTVDATPVNGIVKTVPAGSDVRLAQPSIWSL